MRYDLLLSWQKTERFVSSLSLVYFSSNCDVPVTLSSRFVLHLCFKRVHLPLTEKTPETERYHMDENHQDKIGSKLSTTMEQKSGSHHYLPKTKRGLTTFGVKKQYNL